MLRQKKNESIHNYSERQKLYNLSYTMSNNMNIDEYKQLLQDKSIDYVEFTHEKDTGGTIHIVIPTCQFKIMSKADINKLFKFK